MTQHFLARVLRDLGLLDKIPLVTVVTDPCYGFWRGWACDDVSLYLVATDAARQQLIDYGVDDEKIKICGIPIHPKFQGASEEDPGDVQVELGLDPDRFTIFVNAGWVGGGNIPRIFTEMVPRKRAAGHAGRLCGGSQRDLPRRAADCGECSLSDEGHWLH